ncbi:hypothetical protein JD509_02115 [Aeromonas veronii]|uniref:hypothetical protein n=1 Tax=Aeromonas veronii TaxID=654 RepID=UPI00191DBD5C|nr:hypothetical protein [Aeromonas veronii]MBL0444287.1 hypothetical protein [Aeromonas veronii]
MFLLHWQQRFVSTNRIIFEIMPLPTDQLELAILLQKFAQPENIHDRQVKLIFPISGLDFNDISAALSSSGLLVDESTKRQSIEYQLPANFFINLGEILVSPSRRLSPPDKFYILENDYYYQDGSNNKSDNKIENYLIATQLANVLLSIADYHGGIGSEKTIIFLGKEKLEISIEYGEPDLLFDIKLSNFTATYIDSQIHKEQKKTIIKTVLFELFSGQENVQLLELLHQFDNFLERVHTSYQLYVAEFSFEKVKEQIEKEKLDAMMKLNKVFSDIQNQLLAIPAALILAGGQMVNENSWCTKNTSIWLGVVVMSIFMTMLIRNQRNTLQAVKQEIDQQWLQLAGKYHSVASRFNDSYKQLDSRCYHQEWLIKIISLLVSLSLFITTMLLLHYSVDTTTLIESCAIGIGTSLIIFFIESIYHLRKKNFKSENQPSP